MRKLLAVLFAFCVAAAANAATPPVAAVQASNDRVRAALDRYFKAEGPAKTKARKAIAPSDALA